MYKVFLREKAIWFLSSDSVPEKTGLVFMNPVFTNMQELIAGIDHEPDIRDIYFVSPDAEKLFIDFYSRMSKIAAAGGVVVDEQSRFLFIFRRGKWDLPKGKIDADESEEQAAVREVQEETGMQHVAITGRLTSSYHLYTIGSEWILKETHWFLMKARGRENVLPQAEEGITEVAWVAPTELKKMSEQVYRSLTSVVAESAEVVLQKVI